MSILTLPIGGGLNTSSPPQVLWTAEGRPYLAFDGTTDELVQFSGHMPSDYVSTLAVNCLYSMASAITNNVALRTQVMATTPGENVLTDSFDTLEKDTDSVVPATLNDLKLITASLANVDSIAASDYFAIQIGRENATTGTNATGDMYVWALWLSWATS